MSDLYWLTEGHMAQLEPYFPKRHGKPRVDDRRALSGIVFVNRNRLRWCDAPKDYGPCRSVQDRDDGQWSGLRCRSAQQGKGREAGQVSGKLGKRTQYAAGVHLEESSFRTEGLEIEVV